LRLTPSVVEPNQTLYRPVRFSVEASATATIWFKTRPAVALAFGIAPATHQHVERHLVDYSGNSFASGER
jgi:hypothetical protein